jgi:type I restriction enzyme R subunit
MRHLIDTYIRAEDSQKVSALDDLSLIDLIVARGAEAVNALPTSIRQNPEAVAETIENNVRRLIIDEQPINPKYYERMSALLDALIEQRKRQALEYQAYLAEITALTKKIKDPALGEVYPPSLNTGAKRAFFDNLGRNERLALAIDNAISAVRQDDWRTNPVKVKMVRRAIKSALTHPVVDAGAGEPLEQLVDRILELTKNQTNDY